jgi:hypothetical protein
MKGAIAGVLALVLAAAAVEGMVPSAPGAVPGAPGGMPPTAGQGMGMGNKYGLGGTQMGLALQVGLLANALGMHRPQQAFIPFYTPGLGMGLASVASPDVNPYTMLALPTSYGSNMVNLAAFGPAAGLGQPLTAASPYFGTRGMFTYNIMSPGTGYPYSPFSSNIVGPGLRLSYGLPTAPIAGGPMGINGVASGMSTLL